MDPGFSIYLQERGETHSRVRWLLCSAAESIQYTPSYFAFYEIQLKGNILVETLSVLFSARVRSLSCFCCASITFLKIACWRFRGSGAACMVNLPFTEGSQPQLNSWSLAKIFLYFCITLFSARCSGSGIYQATLSTLLGSILRTMTVIIDFMQWLQLCRIHFCSEK